MRDRIMPHWYKEKRTTEERNSIYIFLKLAGYTTSEAKRMRDWSMNHIKLNISVRFNS